MVIEPEPTAADEAPEPEVVDRPGRRAWKVAAIGALAGVLAGGSLVYVLLGAADRPSTGDRPDSTPARDAPADVADAKDEPLRLVPTRMAPGMVAVPGWRMDRERSMPSTMYLVRDDALVMVNAGTLVGDVPSTEADVEAVFAELVWASQEIDREFSANHWNDVAYTVMDNPGRPVASLDFRMELDAVRYVGTYSFEMSESVDRYVFVGVVQEGRRRTKAFDNLQFAATFDVADQFLSQNFDTSKLAPLEVDEGTGPGGRAA